MSKIGSKRGPFRAWTQAEHDRLISFVRQHGENYELAAKEFGRSVGGVRNRVHRFGPPGLRRSKASRFIPDLTPEQIAEAMRIRATGYRGRMDMRKLAQIMNVRIVQLNRIFRPHEIERTAGRYPAEVSRQYVTSESITVPQHVLIERDRAYDRPRFCAAEILGEPPPGRSALDRMRAGLPVNHKVLRCTPLNGNSDSGK